MAAGAEVLLELFVQGQSARSTAALELVRSICDAELENNYKLEVIDIYQHSDRALKNGVIATPALVRVSPEPVLRTVGKLSAERVREGIGLNGH